MKLSEMSIVELMAWKYTVYKGNANWKVVDAIQREVDHRVSELSEEILVYELIEELTQKWCQKYYKKYLGYFTKSYGVIRECEEGYTLGELLDRNSSLLIGAQVRDYVIYNYDSNTSTDELFLIGTKRFKKDSQELREIRKVLEVKEEG